MARHRLRLFLGMLAIPFATSLCTFSSHATPRPHISQPIFREFKRNLNSSRFMASNDEYRSIADVVGNLHGGKYQFNNYGAVGAYESEYSGCGSGEQYKEEEEEEMPKWAMRMEPSQSDIEQAKLIVVPSNLDPMDGMVYYSLIKIQNEERTWEKFFVKIMAKGQDGKFIQQENGLFIAKPTSGSLAPRGGASNLCDERNPYSDSAEIKIMHNSSGSILIPSIGEFFLVAATEEEMWCYKLRLKSSG